jgi:quinolinate synthase
MLFAAYESKLLLSGLLPDSFENFPEILSFEKQYPEAEVLAHPECHKEVVKLADFVGSTTAIMNRAKESDAKTFIIVTELGVVERLERDYKDKKFVLVSPKAVCSNMKWHYLEDILNSLENEQFEINVDEELAKRAYQPIERMVNINA